MKGTCTSSIPLKPHASGSSPTKPPLALSLYSVEETDPATKDRFNDNLLGSCCCGQGGHYLWKTVCSCKTSAFTCNATCIYHELREKSRYYWAARKMYHKISAHYPNATVWLAGHSLGGVIASLLGLTYGLPTVTFEAFPDALAAKRLGLPTPPGYGIGMHQRRTDTGIYHFGHTADPVFMGTCNTALSSCTLVKYAFQSQCHTGSICTYDTVGDLGWRVSIDTHRILSVIDDVLEPYETVPGCTSDLNCVDCAEWKFFEGNGTGGNVTTTMTKGTRKMSSTSRKDSTSSTTCASPGWWGCRDKNTTTAVTITTTSVTSSAIATTGSGKTSSSTGSKGISSTMCTSPGWWGC